MLTINKQRGSIAKLNRYARQSSSYDQEAQEQINETFILLDQSKNIELKNDYKDFTLVLGPTGSGKSTFVQWFAGDNLKLVVKKKPGGTMLIEDENNIRISNSTIISKTSIPELVIDTEHNAAYYDCPGFRDTRGIDKDIAGTYYTKKLLDHANNIKMIFVVKHVSVQPGVDRDNFMKFLQHVIDLVKNIDKYENSISLITTQVNMPNIADDEIINGITDFLENHIKRILQCSLTVSSDNNNNCKEEEKIYFKQKEFCQKAIKLINIFLSKKDGHFNRIGIFRSPNIEGPVSENKSLQENKKSIEKILYENLKFTTKDNKDFGYTISDKSKNSINYLIESINKNVWNESRLIANRIDNYFHNLIGTIEVKIKSFNSKLRNVEVEESEAVEFLSQFNRGFNLITNLIENVKNLGTDKVAEKIDIVLNGLNFNDCKLQLENIEKQGRYFQFLQSLIDKNLTTLSWETLFQPIGKYLSESEINIQKLVRSTAKKINYEIEAKINSIAEEIKSNFEKKIEFIGIEKFASELHQANNVIVNIQKSSENITSTQELSFKIQNFLNKLDINSYEARSSVSDIFYNGKYLTFLKIISSNQTDSYNPTWINIFNSTQNYLKDSEKFYGFLEKLYEKLSSYDIQIHRDKYNVANIDDWGEENKLQKIDIDKNNFIKFLKKIESFGLADYKFLENIHLSESRLKSLNAVLSYTLHHNLNIYCESDNQFEQKLFIKGNYVKFSDFIFSNDVNLALHKFTNCNDKKNIASINVFALKTIFIDKNLSAIGKKLRFSLIAPKWEIIGKREINLKGENGEQPPEKVPYHVGKPGKPGGLSGSFFGIGDEFVDGYKLEIIANGGQGGKGQDGGIGRDAQDGETPPSDTGYYRNFWCPRDGQQLQYNDIRFHSHATYLNNGFKQSKIDIYGKLAEKSGDGSHGGKGGKGGNKGIITLIENEKKSHISQFRDQGTQGLPGLGGQPGKVGKNGNDVEISCTVWDSILNFFTNMKDQWFFKRYRENGYGDQGNKGLDGLNEEGIENADNSQVIIDQSDIINEYKVYLRDSINSRNNFLFKKSFHKFINYLENNQQIRDIYSIEAFADELYGLENQFHKLDKKDIISYYKSFLNRLNSYAQNHNLSITDDEAKKTLHYLYTYISTRIHYLENNLDSNLIIDIESYLNLIKDNINSLSILEEKTDKQKLVEKQNQFYKDSIDIKIKEANSFADDTMQSALNQAYRNIDAKISSTIEEIKLLEEAEKVKLDELEKKKGELERALTLMPLFTSLKILGQGLSCFGHTGAAVGAVIGLGAGIGESFAVDSKINDNSNNIVIPPPIRNDIALQSAKLANIKDKSNNRVEIEINLIDKELNDNEKSFPDINKKIDDIKNELKTNPSPERKEELKKQLKEKMEAKKVELKNEQTTTNEKFNKNQDKIHKLNRSLQVINIGLDTFNRYQNNQKARDTISKDIAKTSDNIERLKKLESSIYTDMMPMIDKMVIDLEKLISNSKTNSKVGLDFSKWKVQDFLKQMKLKISQSTKELNIQDDLVYAIEKVQDVMTTLINIYDRIQEYQEQKNFAYFIANMSAPCAQTNDYCRIQNNLNRLIKSNMLMIQYKIASNALKQWVFPFADKFIEEFNAPSYFKSNSTDIVNLIPDVKRKIDAMNQNVKKYKSSIINYDKYLHYKDFNSNHNSASEPFYIWKNNEHNEVINRLLSGEEVVLKSQIKNSEPDKDAIKFNLIEINLKLNDQNKQIELNNKLKNFKISATHLGNSYYRYKNKFYVITSDSQTIKYSFEKRNNGYPLDYNVVYSKMRDGNIILSPYTTWKIKLISTTNKNNFDELKLYKDELDLELVGHGSYISNEIDTKNLKVEDYYEKDESIHNDLNSRDTTNLIVKENPNLYNNSSKIRNKRSLQSNIMDREENKGKINNYHNLQATVKSSGINSIMSSSVMKEKSISNQLLGSKSIPISSEPTPQVSSSNMDLLNNTNVNSFLISLNFLTRLFTGYKEKPIDDNSSYQKMNTKSIEIAYEVKSYELVKLFMDKIKSNLAASGLSGDRFLPDDNTINNVRERVKKNLKQRKSHTISDILFKELVEKNFDKMENNSTKKQAKAFLNKFIADLPTIKNELIKKSSEMPASLSVSNPELNSTGLNQSILNRRYIEHVSKAYSLPKTINNHKVYGIDSDN